MRPAPKVDVCITIVVAILFVSSVEVASVIISIRVTKNFQYFSARQMFEEAMQYAKVIFRNRAIDIARERGLIELNRQGKVKKKQKSGADPEVIIGQIIEEHTSVSGGYKKGKTKRRIKPLKPITYGFREHLRHAAMGNCHASGYALPGRHLSFTKKRTDIEPPSSLRWREPRHAV